MRRLAITGFCAIVLLSGCAGSPPQPRVAEPGPKDGHIRLPCKGKDVDTGEWEANKSPTVVFHTDRRCSFTKVYFDPKTPDFSDPVMDPGGETFSSKHTATTWQVGGYKFKYENDYPPDGNGSGIIK